MKRRVSGHGVRVPPGGGRDSTPQNQAVSISGLARVHFTRKSVQIQIGFQAARALGLLDRDQLAYTSDQNGRLTFDRVDGLPIGAQQLLDRAWEADRQRVDNRVLFMQCWNEALHRCKDSPWLTTVVYEQLLQEMGLRTPDGRGYSNSHRQKSEQARERHKAKIPQGGVSLTEPQPVATDRKPRRKRKPSRASAITLVPSA
jgi:hypothetical protein